MNEFDVNVISRVLDETKDHITTTYALRFPMHIELWLLQNKAILFLGPA